MRVRFQREARRKGEERGREGVIAVVPYMEQARKGGCVCMCTCTCMSIQNSNLHPHIHVHCKLYTHTPHTHTHKHTNTQRQTDTHTTHTHTGLTLRTSLQTYAIQSSFRDRVRVDLTRSVTLPAPQYSITN